MRLPLLGRDQVNSRELSVESVHVNEEYGIHESRRDSAVAQALEADGVTFHSYLDQLFFQPGSVLTKTGTYFQVFSQFRKVCYSRLHSALPRVVPTPKAQAEPGVKSDPVPTAVEGFPTPSETLRALWPAGEDEAAGGLFGVADYPRAIVDLKQSRERALAAFRRLPSRQEMAEHE